MNKDSDVTEKTDKNNTVNGADIASTKKKKSLKKETKENFSDEQNLKIDNTDIPSKESYKIKALEQELDKFQKEASQAKEQFLRSQAEVQNTKRRAQLDIEKAHKFALENFIESLIPVVDSLEKGLESCPENPNQNKTMIDGMELTLKQLLSALQKSGVQQISPSGEPFDPNFHEAISMVPNPDVEQNTVIDVFQKGYLLNNRVIRPAMVVVSK